MRASSRSPRQKCFWSLGHAPHTLYPSTSTTPPRGLRTLTPPVHKAFSSIGGDLVRPVGGCKEDLAPPLYAGWLPWAGGVIWRRFRSRSTVPSTEVVASRVRPGSEGGYWPLPRPGSSQHLRVRVVVIIPAIVSGPGRRPRHPCPLSCAGSCFSGGLRGRLLHLQSSTQRLNLRHFLQSQNPEACRENGSHLTTFSSWAVPAHPQLCRTKLAETWSHECPLPARCGYQLRASRAQGAAQRRLRPRDGANFMQENQL